MQGHTNHNQSKTNQSFIFVLRHGLRNIFRPLFITKIISSRTRPGATLPLPWRSRTFKSKINYYISSSRRMRIAGISASFILALLTLLTLAPLTSNANYTEAASSLDDSTTTLTLTTGSTASLAISADSSNGTFATNDSTSAYYTSGSQAASFTVTTNNYTGYTLTLTNSSDNTLVDESDSSNTLEPLSTAINESTFSTNSNYNNMWGYKPSMLSSSSNSNYLPAPSNTTITMNETHCANSGTNGSYSCPNASDTYTIALGARVNYTQSSGTYTKTFVLTTVANAAQYAISYSDNTGDSTVTGIPTNTLAGTSSETSVTLSSAVPTRTGYTFAGWCEGTVSNNGTTCGGTPGTTYSAGGRFYFDRKTNNATTLYALWTVNSYTITFNGDDGVNNFTVNGSTVAKGGTASLTYNQTYPITINYNDGYEAADTNALVKSSGSGSLSGNNFTVGAGIATLYANSKSSSKPLYDTIAAMSKGKQTAADLKTAITVPTSADRTQDTSNSGVYEYDASVFGESSDASNDYAIYYYRGVLENSVGSYGSDGSAVTYPNYVKLSNNTCWRIVRTTGSGGVKMIYNGTWTGSTCANTTTSAQLSTAYPFNSDPSNGKGIVGVGYTFNSSYKTTTTGTTYSTLFGFNSTSAANTTNSTIKTAVDNWYSSNLSSYTGKLETSAGYCNDRTLGTDGNWTSPVANNTSIQRPYGTQTSGFTEYYFGAYVRTYSPSQKPTLTCARGNADLYTTGAASNGNKRLTYPVALLTADEANFAGSGTYHANAFLRSGSYFWLLSPFYRRSSGNVYGFYVSSGGSLGSYYVSDAHGVRPAVSINPGAEIASGSGTATDPWEVSWPTIADVTYMQDVTGDIVVNTTKGATATLEDKRDGQKYTVAKINDNLWMTQNLRFDISAYSMNTDTSNMAWDAQPSSTTWAEDYTTPRIYKRGDSATSSDRQTYGIHYNYCAASAGTNCSDSNSTSSTTTQNICPKGWTLPTQTQINSIGASNSTYVASFAPVLGVVSSSGTLYSTGNGYWWSATAGSATVQYFLRYDGTTLNTGINNKRDGYYVRCVRM